jgi:hypothetical protein
MTETLFPLRPVVTAPPDRHWWVPDRSGSYCLACGLPRANSRHVPKAT